MDQFTLIALLVVLLVVALIVLNSGVRGWLIRFLGIESRVQGHRTVTRIVADDSLVQNSVNEEGVMEIQSRNNSKVVGTTNKRK